uniref:Family with sequence similarity 163 member B n=1 Tax=Catharus ustulatus TaxID=91951 RepID=A0A8C3Y7P1_CATUS
GEPGGSGPAGVQPAGVSQHCVAWVFWVFFSFIKRILILSILFYRGAAPPQSAAAAGTTWGPQGAVTGHPSGSLCCAAGCCSLSRVWGCGGE